MNDTLIVDQPSSSANPAVPAPRVDFGVAAADYAKHRQGYPLRLWERLADLGVATAGQRVVDVGTGTGAVARALAARGAHVTGVDPSPRLLAEAARLAEGAGLEIAWRHATAEDTGLPAGAFDTVIAGSAWHWFDRPRAAAEARRLLRPGGALAMVHLDWRREPGSAMAVTLDLVDRYRTEPLPKETELHVLGMYPHWPIDLAGAGFVGLEVFGFDLELVYGHEAWRGRMRASAAVSTMSPDAQAAFEADLTRALAMGFADPTPVPHRVFAVIGRAPAATLV